MDTNRLYNVNLIFYQLYELEKLLKLKKPFNYSKYMINNRENNKKYMNSLILHNHLLNLHDVLDVGKGLYYHFENNKNEEMELVIDVYDQKIGGAQIDFFIDNFECNINNDEIYHNNNKKKKCCGDILFEALKVINEIT